MTFKTMRVQHRRPITLRCCLLGIRSVPPVGAADLSRSRSAFVNVAFITGRVIGSRRTSRIERMRR